MSNEFFIKKLKECVRKNGGNAVVAEGSGVTLSALNKYISGASEPTISKVQKLATFFNITIDELMYDKAEMPDSKFSYEETILIPLRDITAAAGAGSINDIFEGEAAIVAQIPFSREMVRGWGRPPDKIEAIFAKGDSMFPTIKDGDIVLIHRADRTWLEGAVMALSSPDGLRLKRLQKAFDGSWLLVSDNKTLYDPEKLTSFDVEQIRTIGRAFWAGGMI